MSSNISESNNILNETSYFIDIYVDIVKDDYCLTTRYRFNTKELAKLFLDFLDNKTNGIDKNIVYDNIECETKRSIMGYTYNDPYRPQFTDIDTAIKDFNNFMSSTYSYNYIDVDPSNTYIYKSNIFTERLDEFENRYLYKKITILEKENKELKNRLALITKLIYDKINFEEISSIINRWNN